VCSKDFKVDVFNSEIPMAIVYIFHIFNLKNREKNTFLTWINSFQIYDSSTFHLYVSQSSTETPDIVVSLQ